MSSDLILKSSGEETIEVASRAVNCFLKILSSDSYDVNVLDYEQRISGDARSAARTMRTHVKIGLRRKSQAGLTGLTRTDSAIANIVKR